MFINTVVGFAVKNDNWNSILIAIWDDLVVNLPHKDLQRFKWLEQTSWRSEWGVAWFSWIYLYFTSPQRHMEHSSCCLNLESNFWHSIVLPSHFMGCSVGARLEFLECIEKYRREKRTTCKWFVAYILLWYWDFAIHYSLFSCRMISKAKRPRSYCHAVRQKIAHRTFLARKTCFRDLHFPMTREMQQSKIG